MKDDIVTEEKVFIKQTKTYNDFEYLLEYLNDLFRIFFISPIIFHS